MSAYAPSPYQAPSPAEITGSQLSEEERDKLQEIHELINLMIRELPVMAQTTARSYTMPALPTVPYTYSFFQFPWGVIPFLPPRGV